VLVQATVHSKATVTFTGNKTFSGTLTASGTITVSAATASIGTATGRATYGIGSGATTTGLTKTVNLGTGGASGLTTVVNIGSPTLTDMGASFAIATGGVLTLYIAAPPNGSSVWLRVLDEVSGAIFEQEITGDLPAATQFLSPRLFLNTGATAAAVAYDCAGSYLETDF